MATDNSPLQECRACRQALDPSDRFCRRCGAHAGATRGAGWLRRPMPTPEQAATYWHNFFRPFFMMVFLFFGAFFAAALVLIALWFAMFRA